MSSNIALYIKLLTGDLIIVECAPADTILMLKQRIYEHLSGSDENLHKSTVDLSPLMQRLVQVPSANNDDSNDGDCKEDLQQELSDSRTVGFYNLQSDDMLMLFISDSFIPPECLVLDQMSCHQDLTLLSITPSIFEARPGGAYRFATSSAALPSDRVSTWSAVLSCSDSDGYARVGVCGTFATAFGSATDRNDMCGSYYALRSDTYTAYVHHLPAAGGGDRTVTRSYHENRKMAHKSGDNYVFRFVPAAIARLDPEFQESDASDTSSLDSVPGGDLLIRHARTGNQVWVQVMHSPIYVTVQLSGNHRVELRQSTAEELASVPQYRGRECYNAE